MARALGLDSAIRWVADYYAALAPHSEPGGYVNFASADDQLRVRDNFGAAYERLAQIKRRYDPDNFFHINQKIEPREQAEPVAGPGAFNKGD